MMKIGFQCLITWYFHKDFYTLVVMFDCTKIGSDANAPREVFMFISLNLVNAKGVVFGFTILRCDLPVINT